MVLDVLDEIQSEMTAPPPADTAMARAM